MKKGLLIVASGVCALALGSGLVWANTVHNSTPKTAHVTTGALPSSVPSFVSSLARKLASQNGDSIPAGAQVVLTTRQAANSLAFNATVKSNQSVYLVVMKGHFVDKNAFLPPNAKAPTGTTLSFVVDPTTHQVLDFGINNTNPALSHLGHAANLPVH